MFEHISAADAASMNSATKTCVQKLEEHFGVHIMNDAELHHFFNNHNTKAIKLMDAWNNDFLDGASLGAMRAVGRLTDIAQDASKHGCTNVSEFMEFYFGESYEEGERLKNEYRNLPRSEQYRIKADVYHFENPYKVIEQTHGKSLDFFVKRLDDYLQFIQDGKSVKLTKDNCTKEQVVNLFISRIFENSATGILREQRAEEWLKGIAHNFGLEVRKADAMTDAHYGVDYEFYRGNRRVAAFQVKGSAYNSAAAQGRERCRERLTQQNAAYTNDYGVQVMMLYVARDNRQGNFYVANAQELNAQIKELLEQQKISERQQPQRQNYTDIPHRPHQQTHTEIHQQETR